MKQSAREQGSRTDDEEPPPPEILAAMRAFQEQHMRDWLDHSIPALGCLTPRETANTTRGRQQLALLLKEIQQTEDRLPVDQRIDLYWIREALGNL